jgi:beta-lactamase regulating signal transducer with metallopeptidase domain
MNSLFALRALLFAGECFAASAVLLPLTWLASKAVKDASLRHVVWLTAFGTLLILPVAALIVPPQIAIHRPADEVRAVPAYVEPLSDANAAGIETEMPAPAPVAATAVPFSWHSLDEREIAIALFAVWFAGFFWAAFRLALGASGLAALRRASRPHALAPADLPKLASSRRECELRLSPSQDGPMTWGLLKPVILLPKDSIGWSRERLQAVLLHELAHVRRRDSLSQTLSLIVCALYWPNPLIWIGARAMRRDAEIAADDAVIVSGMKPSAYAGELLQLASEFRGHGLAVSGVSMAGQSSLEARVKSVLAPNQLRTGVRSMDVFKIACLGLAATALLAVARPDIVAAQDTQDTTVMPAPAAAPSPPAAPSAPEAVPDVPSIAAVPTAPVPPADATGPDDDEAAVNAVAPSLAHKHRKHVHIVRVENGKVVEDAMRDIDMSRAQIERTREQMRQAEAEIRRIQPEIERAIAAAKIDQRVAEALRDVDPKVRAEVARALEQARPAIRKAIADAHISERVAQALKDAQPKIDAAIVRIHKRVDKDGNVTIEREDHGDDLDVQSDEDNDNDEDSNDK